MKIKNFLLPLSVIVLVIVGVWFLKSFQKTPGEPLGDSNSKVVVYYGDTCPHCHDVIDWLDENQQIKDHSGVIFKEVYKNQANAQQMMAKAEECNLSSASGIGVPFLYDQGQCIIGGQSIIEYLQENY